MDVKTIHTYVDKVRKSCAMFPNLEQVLEGSKTLQQRRMQLLMHNQPLVANMYPEHADEITKQLVIEDDEKIHEIS